MCGQVTARRRRRELRQDKKSRAAFANRNMIRAMKAPVKLLKKVKK